MYLVGTFLHQDRRSCKFVLKFIFLYSIFYFVALWHKWSIQTQMFLSRLDNWLKKHLRTYQHHADICLQRVTYGGRSSINVTFPTSSMTSYPPVSRNEMFWEGFRRSENFPCCARKRIFLFVARKKENFSLCCVQEREFFSMLRARTRTFLFVAQEREFSLSCATCESIPRLKRI